MYFYQINAVLMNETSLKKNCKWLWIKASVKLLVVNVIVINIIKVTFKEKATNKN